MLLETKKLHIKTFKTALFDCESMKNVSVLTEDRAFDLFFRSHPGGFDSSGIPTPGNLPSKAKKNANDRGVMGAAGIEPESPPALQNTQVQADSSLCNRTAGRNSDQTRGRVL